FGGVPFCWIPPGAFSMGRAPEDTYGLISEEPRHDVTLARGFWMGKYEVTQAQWLAVMGGWPGVEPSALRGLGDRYPAYYVSLDDIRGPQGYLERLNQANPGIGFRLPSEAEWEYAYRAGTTTRFYWGEDPETKRIGEHAWYQGNSSSKSAMEAGLKRPNAWGLHDMAGNLYEYCEDDWHRNYDGAPDDGRAWKNDPAGGLPVRRGGSWNSTPAFCRSAYRATVGSQDYQSSYWFGFRIACSSHFDSKADSPEFSDSAVFILDAREETLGPLVNGAPYTTLSALEDGVAEVMRDLNGDGYPDAFQDGDNNGKPDAFEPVDDQGRHINLLDTNNNTFPDWFETRYPAPVAKFVISGLDLDTLAVSVRNLSVAGISGQEAITGYQWDFGDGTVVDDFEPPAHVYGTLMNYTITLTLFWTGGDPVTWERRLLPGIQTNIIYVDAERGRDEDGFGGSWAAPFRTLDHALTKAEDSFGVDQVWARAGTYTGTESDGITLRTGIALYGGFSGNETLLDERDLATGTASIIDGENARRCVTGANNALLDGFTLTKGASSSGAGIFCDNTAPEIRNCCIINNASSDNGGGVRCQNTRSEAPRFVNCVIAKNSANGEGAGISVWVDSQAAFFFCTIANNTGVGVTNHNALSTLHGCIVWGNTGGGIVNTGGGAPEVSYCIVQGGYPGFTGNLNQDPLFFDSANGDYRILFGSPALDAAWAPEIPPADIFGQSRPWGSGPDMGAFEYHGEAPEDAEELPLDSAVERIVAHGRTRAFLTPVGSAVTSDIVAILTPSAPGAQFRLDSGTGGVAIETDTGFVLITPRVQVPYGTVFHTVSVLNWADTTAENP
ncbi:MAG TPA: SUMF1/EgtB/PvdO family nonheme iron enzyme, partial [Candidatus Hydrogenedentes bacterium]|nr:SUMF1/EgtB/PvdO family nonheme iron enzyme [Candidatus Hydrogenedentota bacterium]